MRRLAPGRTWLVEAARGGKDLLKDEDFSSSGRDGKDVK